MTAPAGTVSNADSPNVADYDVILVNSSAGKDSQASLDVVVEAARAADVFDRLLVVHADLGDNEWPDTAELAAEHAAHYDLPFEIVRREQDGAVETILDRVEKRGMWPDAARRWCTSDHKRGPIRKLMTRVVSELRESGQVVDRPVHLLNVMGFRAEEGPARRKRCPYAVNRPASNGRRRVDDWYPIHDWTLARVWRRIAAAGTRPHWAYAEGMSRLSCRFCVLASRADLVCSARLNPELAEQYAAVERRTGHRFRKDLSMAEVVAAANDTDGHLSLGAQRDQGLLQVGDLAEPDPLAGFGDPLGQVGRQLAQQRQPTGPRPEQGTADTGFGRAGAAVGDLAQGDVLLELGPLGVGRRAAS